MTERTCETCKFRLEAMRMKGGVLYASCDHPTVDDCGSRPATHVCEHYEHQPANKEGAE